jgi:hypothetical protein
MTKIAEKEKVNNWQSDAESVRPEDSKSSRKPINRGLREDKGGRI